MRQKSLPAREPAPQVLKDIRRATRRHFSAEDKIRIVLEGVQPPCCGWGLQAEDDARKRICARSPAAAISAGAWWVSGMRWFTFSQYRRAAFEAAEPGQ